MKPIIVGMTGASGVLYGVRLVKILLEMDRKVDLVISEPARLVIREEMGKAHSEIFPSSANLELHSPKDFSAPIASGSYPVEAMIIIPCSMGTLGAIASGLSQNLIHRAADCVIKEGRKLVLVPRETPLSAIHLENMLKLARLSVSIVPAMPGFYSGAESLSEVVDFMVGKVLDQIGISHALYPRWVGMTKLEKS